MKEKKRNKRKKFYEEPTVDLREAIAVALCISASDSQGSFDTNS